MTISAMSSLDSTLKTRLVGLIALKSHLFLFDTYLLSPRVGHIVNVNEISVGERAAHAPLQPSHTPSSQSRVAVRNGHQHRHQLPGPTTHGFKLQALAEGIVIKAPGLGAESEPDPLCPDNRSGAAGLMAGCWDSPRLQRLIPPQK